MLGPRAGALTFAAAVLLLLSGCAPSSSSPPGALATTTGGFVVITAGGTALVDGQDDVPPTLDLRVVVPGGVTAQQVVAKLDGADLSLQRAQDALTATVAPMPLGSAHTLDLAVPDRDPQRIAFHVAPPAGAAAALHTDPAAGTVLDLAFQFAPTDREAVESALPGGATVSWPDATHLRATWPTGPGGTLQLPAGLATARGSHLAATLSLNLSAVAHGALRRSAIPVEAAAATPKPLVVAFTAATAASRASLAAHADRISVVSPTGVRVTAGGALSGAPDATAVATATAAGVPVWPLIQNDASDSDGIAAILADDSAVNRLVRDAVALGYPGVHLDIEGVPAGSRDRLTVLVQRLAAALHQQGRQLAVAVVPHKPEHLNVYSAAYDLQAISAAADLVTLMAYDEHTALSDAGPVAGLDWDEQILSGSLAEMRSRSTALLGLPLYSRAWQGGQVTADSYAASIANALNAQGARVDYDFAAATPVVRGPDGGLLYFDDAQSLAAKQSLVGSRHLRGVALWRLGFEDPAMWDTLPTDPPRP
ncbi:MAG TPA: glycosyl hydrolase family 18 protein [Candidatus Dormibacteraeota bacterium]|nr:glycosyl hydrolase family 18 protein [Candidatus Dormibacteraeota bacterium]